MKFFLKIEFFNLYWNILKKKLDKNLIILLLAKI